MQSHQYDYDFLVIGAGSGGTRAARMAASTGCKVAIIEAYRAGGTCVIRGCVPKKLYVYASRFGSEFDLAESFGFDKISEPSFNWHRLQNNKNTEIARLEQVYQNLLKNSGVQFYAGTASFISENKIRILETDTVISAEKILIATGAKPRKLVINHQEAGITSDDVFELQDLPKSVLIYGAGYIGTEFAGILNGLGVKVALGYRSVQILNGFDIDLVKRLTDEYTRMGIQFFPNLSLDAFTFSDKTVSVYYGDSTYSFDCLLNTTGRVPNTDQLNLSGIGITTDASGRVITDNNFATCVPNIYAIGDVSHSVNLTPVAIAQAMSLVQTLFYDNPQGFNPVCIPTSVFTTPELATVGITEEEARRNNLSCKIYESEFRPMKVTLSSKATKTYMKMIVDKQTDKILGIHLLGYDSAEMIQLLGICITAGLTKKDFDRTLAVHPTSAEELVTMRQHTREI